MTCLDRISRNLLKGLVIVAAVVAAGSASADEVAVPYWASLRGREANLRVGPGEDYRISWRYHREHLPMKVLRVMDGWRLVQDPDGTRGWMLARFLKRERGAIVTGDAATLAEVREKAAGAGRLRWRVEPGVTGRLGECADGWCEFDAAGHKGFVQEGRLWGAGQP